mmetsp:Transcript_27843/g.47290  ORF Transcript_27843/g.47290 Transcript_27843/m.47290 type:complete len:132 (-) Transcript_27843:30-425(-)
MMRWLYEVGLGAMAMSFLGVDASRPKSSCWGMGEPGAVSGVCASLLVVPTLLGVLSVLPTELCLFFFRLNNLTPIVEEEDDDDANEMNNSADPWVQDLLHAKNNSSSSLTPSVESGEGRVRYIAAKHSTMM